MTKAPVKLEYKTIELNSVANYDRVARMLASGWKVWPGRRGMFTVTLERRTPKRKRKESNQ